MIRSDNGHAQNPMKLEGRMGAGKTTGLLSYAADQLRKGHVKTVVYLAPRKVLVDMVCDKIKQIPALNSKRHKFDVLLYYQNSPDKLALLERKAPHYERQFICCCINSIECINNSIDILIVDEIGMSVGNMFLNWSRLANDYINFGA